MIEGSRLPGVVGMADLTFFRKPPHDMRWVLRLRKLCSMANCALMRQSAKKSRMTTITIQVLMRAVERKCRCVFKARLIPTKRSLQMASLAIRFELCRGVIGVLRSCKIRLVAIPAIHRRTGKILALVLGMAGVAVDHLVHTIKWKTLCLMQAKDIFLRAPICRRMTAIASAAQLIMVNVAMTIDAGNSNIGEAQILMAFSTGHLLMFAGKWKTCLPVIKGHFPT